MSQYPKLSKPPIVEAVIEFRVRLSENVDHSRFDAFQAKISNRFPHHTGIRSVQARFDIQPGSEATQTIDDSIIGVRLESADKHTVILATINALSVSRLQPYDSWENLLAEAKAIWPVYCEIIKPMAVIRLGVRYINRIVLQGDMIDFDDVLTVGPQVPTNMPQVLMGFFSRLVIPMNNERAVVAISQAMEAAPNPLETPQIAVLLDIDAYNEDAHEISSSEIWDTLDCLRATKNMAFFNSVTTQELEKMK